MEVTPDALTSAAARVGLPPEALPTVLEALSAGGALVDELVSALETGAPGEGLSAVKAAGLLARHGAAGERALHLVLALAQVPHAERRSRARGVDEELTRRTLSDLSVWARHFQAQVGGWGITLEILDWSQRYLRGTLVRVGCLQFDLLTLKVPLRVWRHAKTGELAARFGEAVLDLSTGDVREGEAPPLGAEWGLVLAPGAPILDMHIPADGRIVWSAVVKSAREGFELFARLQPGTSPLAVCGEAWLLDPQVTQFLPRSRGLQQLQRGCHRYPSALPEAKTIRRLFGPDATRAEVVALPREGLDSLRRAVAQFLSEPTSTLRARGGLLLYDELLRTEAD